MQASHSSTLPFVPSASTPQPQAPTSPSSSSDDQSQSFAEVLHQQGGDSPKATIGPAPTDKDAKVVAVPPLTVSIPSTESPTQTKTVDLAVKAPVIASNTLDAIEPIAQTATPTIPRTVAPPAAGKAQPVGASISAGSDLTTMMVQAMLLASNLRTPTSPPKASGTSIAIPDPKESTIPAKDSPSTAAQDVSALMAQAAASTPALAAAPTTSVSASIIAAKTTTSTKSNIPVLAAAKTLTPIATKEKKSSTETSERSFLQSDASSPKDETNPLNLFGTAVTSINYQTGHQSFTAPSSPEKNPSGGLSSLAASGVGTPHVEKKSTMNIAASTPEILTGPSASTTSRPSADVNILLNSNHDFEDAIKQVVHIAQLSEASFSRTPTRVAIELQTPPGAIVHVYVSSQNNQYRAQLSTNDPAALSWVQDKITSLRQSNDLGVEVKWLPAQMESNSISAPTTSGNDANLNSNRDGQNQQNYQQPDERSQYQRERSSYEDLAEVEADSFAASFETIGGVA